MSVAEFTYTVLLKPKPLRTLANAFLRSLIPPMLNVGDARIALNPRDPVVSGALMLKVYERPETDFFLATFRPGMSFLDIGANVGYYTALAMSRGRGRSRVIAMEPDPESFLYLKKTVLANGGPTEICVNKAAADRAGAMTLYVSADNRGDNRLYDNDFRSGTCTVDAVTVDDLLDSLRVETVDFIKMDVQGYEGHALRGMQRTIRSSRSLILLMEFWPYGLACAGSSPNDVLKSLASTGLLLFELSDNARLNRVQDYNELIERLPGRRYANIVAIRNVMLPALMFTQPTSSTKNSSGGKRA